MIKESQLSHKKFEIIYVDIPPSRRCTLPLAWAARSDFLSESPAWKGGAENLFSGQT